MPREVRDIQFNSGYNACEARMSILKNETVHKDLDYSEIRPEDVEVDSFIYVENDGNPSKMRLSSIIDERQGLQVDWDETNPDSLSFIKNKPEMKLEENIIAAYNVGGIKAGDVVEKGTSLDEVIKRILSIAESAFVRFGVLNTVDDINPDYVPSFTVDVPTILQEGLVFKDIDLKNQYYVLLVPNDSDLRVSGVFQSGYKLSTKSKTIVDAAGKSWTAYYPSVPATGLDYIFMYRFERLFK